MFEQTFKNIDDVLWKEAGCTTELDYTEQTSWLLFLNTLTAWRRTGPRKRAWTGRSIRTCLKSLITGRVGPRRRATERLASIDERKLPALGELKKSLLRQARRAGCGRSGRGGQFG
jgi:hypothetical protein